MIYCDWLPNDDNHRLIESAVRSLRAREMTVGEIHCEASSDSPVRALSSEAWFSHFGDQAGSWKFPVCSAVGLKLQIDVVSGN